MKKTFMYVCLALLPWLGKGQTDTAKEGQELTLSQAISYALAQKADAQKAQLDIRKSEYKIQEVRANALPNLSATGAVTYNPKLQATYIDASTFAIPGMPGPQGVLKMEMGQKWSSVAEARELGMSPSEVASMDNVEEMIEVKRAEEAKPKTEAEKLELTRKKALNKLDFYERVVRSVAREEAEVAGYYEIMGEEKARPSIMDEQNQAPAETTTEASTQEATEVEAEVK